MQHGHELVGKKDGDDLKGSCDFFVLETDVHYPTDINLLFDAIRRAIILIMRLCGHLNIGGWRQWKKNIRKIKQLFRKVQQMKRSTSKDKKKQAKRDQLIIDAHTAYLELVQSFLDRIKENFAMVQSCDMIVQLKIQQIEKFIAHAERQIDQIRRRAVKGETIPHNEKVFSIFEEHTEWIVKGKAGVSQELGLKVCVVKDQYGFILYHRVMQDEADAEAASSCVSDNKGRQTLSSRTGEVCQNSEEISNEKPCRLKNLYNASDMLRVGKKMKAACLPSSQNRDFSFGH